MRPRRVPLEFLLLAVVALLVAFGCSKKDSPTSPTTGPTANFVAAPVSGNSPMDVDFTNQSVSGSSAITSTVWTFGDGTTSTQNNPFHTYGSPGTYTVSLTVTTADGSDTRVRDDYIVVGSGPGTTPPNALFSGTPAAGSAPLNVQFTDQSTPGSSPITSWAWTFGDGGTSTAQNPSHSYGANGSYTVSLTVTTSVGSDTNTKTSYISVSPIPVAPTADFTGTPTEGAMPLTVQFTDQSNAGSAPITVRNWTFGDGGTSIAPNPSHTYLTAGTYTVSLTVTTLAGSDGETKTGYITVRPTPVPPTAQFSGTPTTGPAPLDVDFTDLSTPGTSPITAWDWTFGDGGTSIQQNPSHTFTGTAEYDVALTVTTADGQNTVTKSKYINPCATPVADFTGTPATGDAPLTVSFHDASSGGPNTFSWNFGDGSTSTAKDVNHVYNTPGTYTVTHAAGNACGTDTNTKTGFITVVDPCPNPVYSVVSAVWDTPRDADGDGYFERKRLRWNADVSTGCVRSVFAKIYYRTSGTTDDWILRGQSGCYNITDDRSSDLGSFQVSSLPHGCYDFRIVLFECNGTTEEAILEPSGDSDLTNQCFEP